MKAFVSIQDFGSHAQLAALAAYLATITELPIGQNQQGSLLIVCDVGQLGGLFAALAGDEKTDWIEYTVQFG